MGASLRICFADQVFARASRVVADSRAQCLELGECSHAAREGAVDAGAIEEIGHLVVAAAGGGRARGASDITVFDSTGTGAQDAAIAELVLREVDGAAPPPRARL